MNSEYSHLFERLNEQLNQVEEILQPLKDSESIFDLVEEKDDLEQAKQYVSLSYAINSALYSYYKLHGASTNEASIMSELQRVKQYVGKIKHAEKQVQPNSEEKNDQRPKVAKEAASRIIKHHT
ncbi:substrate-specific nuclear cofactor for exosome activity [Schizosaccharomyces cryophilus OY26]|uniref:Exosome complex protein n=1 Tax=Schizosaccharomyces cryophilus (strain OY26 / ATCC MYA-4695 / CBS 11777 / NBRC 106824 / NRRL Y48691) TaxID=653667 RepID=S9VY80_SCHCR|nr:substrate-specific nuclear cofactor for exosome activity [Schizosaccharomyces cryophilus OY26]EPY51199.1 substrate-specific nuclear cofactor for exosome activity [Schizosaccharomyces cryophilus OY26]